MKKNVKKDIKKDDFDISNLLDFFDLSEKVLDDLIFKLKTGKKLDFSDNLLIDRVHILYLIIHGRTK